MDRTSLVVQQLRLHVSTAGGMGLISGGGTKIPHACGVARELKKKKKLNDLNRHFINADMKRCSVSLVMGKCKLKP